jgi:hypothetical protein
MGGVTVNGRVFWGQRVHIRHRHQDSGPPERERFRNGDLVEVERVVVVDGRPEPVAQIPGVAGQRGWRFNHPQFPPGGRGEVRLQAAPDHGAAGDGGKSGPVVHRLARGQSLPSSSRTTTMARTKPSPPLG